jgi:carboxymethylenebutenolidase
MARQPERRREIVVTQVEITTPRGVMPAYVGVPTVDPPWPGVVVVHDFTGMSADLRAQADWLAEAGFLEAVT